MQTNKNKCQGKRTSSISLPSFHPPQHHSKGRVVSLLSRSMFNAVFIHMFLVFFMFSRPLKSHSVGEKSPGETSEGFLSSLCPASLTLCPIIIFIVRLHVVRRPNTVTFSCLYFSSFHQDVSQKICWLTFTQHILGYPQVNIKFVKSWEYYY